MRKVPKRPAVALITAFAVAASVMSFAAPTTAAEPATFDYRQIQGLSEPIYSELETTTMKLPMSDGTQIHLVITKPTTVEPTRFPVIFEASPYHGTIATRIGDRIFPDPKNEAGEMVGLTGYFAPRGYAVVMMDLRGTGLSKGCLDHLGPKDASDLKETIEWLADQEWSNGRVGMTGHSYVGSTPIAAAAQRPRGLATIAPSAGLASMYDHQFQRGVPYNLQYVGPQVAYETLALQRDMPPGSPPPPVIGSGNTGENFANGPNPEMGCGMKNSAALAGTGQVTGQYELWHAQRDWRAAASDADIPMFMIHGVNDNAARIPAAEWFFGSRFNRPGDKVWLGQWDHGSTNGRCGNESNQRVSHPNCRFNQWTFALHAWFDKHLAQRDVATGPAVEVFLNGEEPQSVTRIADPEQLEGKVYTTDGWSRPADRVTFYPAAQGNALSTQAPAAAGTVTLSPTANALIAHNQPATAFARFVSEPLTEDTLFLGLPKLDLHASVTNSQVVHFVATLVRIDEDNLKESMNTCAGAPLLRDSIHTVSPVVPREEMSVPLQCFTMAHWVPAGNRLELTIGTNDAPGGSPHHAPFGSDAQITIHTGPSDTNYLLPVAPPFTLTDDVPLR